VRIRDGSTDEAQSERGQELHDPDQPEMKCRLRDGEDLPDDRRAQHRQRRRRREAGRQIEAQRPGRLRRDRRTHAGLRAKI
jgi:hypothetical protein